ncbi:MAG: MFS transporter [Chitinophagaceae bacterium]|nr:MFS transporter [Chitinophagaceae bacterium]
MKFSEAARLRILYFLAFSCTAAWQPIFSDYLVSHNITGFKLGLILAITPFLMFAVQPFYGMLADKFGYKKCLLLSSILASVSFLLYLAEGGFAYLAVVTVCMSVFYNSTQPLLDSLSLNFIKRNPNFSYGSLRIAGAAGWACTGIIVGYYISMLSTAVIFAASAISMLLTFVFAFFLQYDKERDEETAKLTIRNDLKEILQNRKLMILLFGVFLVYAASAPVYYFYSIYLKENGADSVFVGYALSFQGLCELPFFYFSARIIGKLGTRNTLIIAVFAAVLRLLLYNQVKDPYWVLPVELLQGVCWSLFWAASVEQVNVLVRDELRATGQSFLTGAMLGAGAIAGNFWVSFLNDKQLPVSQVFFINALIIVGIGIFMMLTLPRVPRPSSGSGTSLQT